MTHVRLTTRSRVVLTGVVALALLFACGITLIPLFAKGQVSGTFTVTFADGSTLTVTDNNDTYWQTNAGVFSSAQQMMNSIAAAGSEHSTVTRTATSVSCANGVSAYIGGPPVASYAESAYYSEGSYAPYSQGSYAPRYFQGTYYAEASYCVPTLPNHCVDGVQFILDEVLDSCGGYVDYCPNHGNGWTCSAGACIPPGTYAQGSYGGPSSPPPTATISGKPTLVRLGNTSVISWTSLNAASCYAKGSNGDGGVGAKGWSGTPGSQTSSALDQQTIYTLICTGLDGSTITATATINIVPAWQEP